MAAEAFQDDRAVELSSIAAIFPELVLDPSDPYHATIELAVTPLNPLRITFEQPSADAAPPQLPTPPTSIESGEKSIGFVLPARQNTGTEVHALEHLPPLKLDISLQEGYPVDDPPRIHLLVTEQWLPRKKLQELEAYCARLWEELGRDLVIYSYIDHLQQQAENAFGLSGISGDPLPLPADIKLALLDYDLRVKREKFDAETFDCGICLEPKKGRDCHRLFLCGDVFCNACLIDFYSNCISEGDIDSVKCLAPTCAKDVSSVEPPRKKRKQDRTLNPSELLQIPLSQEFVQRYVRLKRKKKLESSKNTIYCPRQWCQGPAYPEHRKQKAADDFDDFSESDEETPEPAASASHSELLSIPMEKRLAICSDCNYAFCFVCNKTWHGSHSTAGEHCNPRSAKELDAEEQATMDYLKRHSTPCPTCGAPAQKTMGCNHMICFRCNTHFCYLCSSFLNENNPYAHFNDIRSTCHLRLWELEGGDGEGAGYHFFGVGGEGVAWDEDLPEAEQVEAAAPVLAEPAQPEAPPVPPAMINPNHDDSSDDEPAPDIRRRERAIEFVNFADPQRGGRRINIPDRERAENDVPPAAPEPPRNVRGGGGQQANRIRRQLQNEPPHNQVRRQFQMQPGVAAAAAIEQPINEFNQVPVVDDDPERMRLLLEMARQMELAANVDAAVDALPHAAPEVGDDAAAANHAPVRGNGLDRFLELARLDAEDEWDSDELDEDDDGEGWEWGFDEGAGRRGGGNVNGIAGRGGRGAGNNAGRGRGNAGPIQPMRVGRNRGNNAAHMEARMARGQGGNQFGGGGGGGVRRGGL